MVSKVQSFETASFLAVWTGENKGFRKKNLSVIHGHFTKLKVQYLSLISLCVLWVSHGWQG